MDTKMKAIIYCRVSTKDQAEHGYSLGSQERSCNEFALKRNYEVAKNFIERGESAKTQDRTQLIKLLEYLYKNKGKIQAVIVWKIDRLTRSTTDYHALLATFEKLKIKLLSVTENNEETPTGEFLRSMFAALAQLDNKQKGERTISGMREAVRNGRWVWRPPIGYKASLDTRGKYLIIPSDKSEYIAEIFKLAETGLYRQFEIANRLKKKGFKEVNKKLINRIIPNPIYAGLIVVDWATEPIKAIHEPIVSQATFFKANQVLKGKKLLVAPKLRNHPDFPLRNFVKCFVCKKNITGSKSTGRKQVRYSYYRCQKYHIGCRKDFLENLFYKKLKGMEPKPALMRAFELIIIKTWKEKKKERFKEKARLEREIKSFEEQKNNLVNLKLRDVFDDETYKQKYRAISEEITLKKIQLNDSKEELIDIEPTITYCKYFISNIADLWMKGDLDLRQRCQSIAFPNGIEFDGEKVETTITSFVFNTLSIKNKEIGKMANQIDLSWNHIIEELITINKLKNLQSTTTSNLPL